MQYEDYCSFETSKQLKECGFPQEQEGYRWWYDNEELFRVHCCFLKSDYIKYIVCPTLEQAKKWLMDVKNIYVYVMLHPGGWWEFGLESLTNEEIEDAMPNMNNSYPEALEAGIVAALNYLKEHTQK